MKKTIKIVAILFIVAIALLVLSNSVLAAEAITLNEENPTYNLTGNVEGQIVVESGNVTITGDGTLTCPTGSAILVRGGNVTINGGTFISDSDEVFNQSALYVDANGTATVNAGTFTGNKYNYAVRVHASTLTVNGGTIHADNAASVACCGGTLNVNGGTWSSDGEWTVDGITQSDILAACAMESGKQANVVVKGGTFVDFDPTKIYYSTGFESSVVESTGTAVAEGYAYDTETGTVACAHENIVKVDEVPATYEASGIKAHYSCSTCIKVFEDAEGTKEITDLTTLAIPMLEKPAEEENPPSEEGNPPEEEPQPEDDKKEEVKDETPKTGAVSFVAILAVIALAGLVFVKRK